MSPEREAYLTERIQGDQRHSDWHELGEPPVLGPSPFASVLSELTAKRNKEAADHFDRMQLEQANSELDQVGQEQADVTVSTEYLL